MNNRFQIASLVRSSNRFFSFAIIIGSLLSLFSILAERPAIAANEINQKPIASALDFILKDRCGAALNILQPIAALQIPNQKALELGNSNDQRDIRDAQSLMGAMYYEGGCLPQDYAEARKWLSLAFKNGDDQSVTAFSLARMYVLGQGVEKDYLKGAYFARRSAGHVSSSQVLLATIYNEGRYGVEKDLIRSYAWLNLAISQPKTLIYPKTLSGLLEWRNKMSRSMAKDQLLLGQELSRECYDVLYLNGWPRDKEYLPERCK